MSNIELFIQMRAQELYQEWCNNPDSSVADTIAKGMMDAVHHCNNTRTKLVEGVFIVEQDVAEQLAELSGRFLLNENELLKHLISLGRLASSTELYIKNKSGAFVELGDIK